MSIERTYVKSTGATLFSRKYLASLLTGRKLELNTGIARLSFECKAN